MKTETYVELLECAVLSLLSERNSNKNGKKVKINEDLLIPEGDFDDILIPKDVSDHPSFREGGRFCPYILKEKINEMRLLRKNVEKLD